MTVSGRCLQNGPLTDSIKQKRIGNSRLARGFTIIELIIVIVIIGILTTIAVPSMREWALEGQVETKAAEVRNLFELVRTKATAMGKVGYVVGLGPDRVQIGLNDETFDLRNSVNSSPRVIMGFIDVDQNSTFNFKKSCDENNPCDEDEIVALVDMGNVQSHLGGTLGGTFAVLPSGISGQLDESGPKWYTQLTNAVTYPFYVYLSTGGNDFFKYEFDIDRTGSIQENRCRIDSVKESCPKKQDKASSN